MLSLPEKTQMKYMDCCRVLRHITLNGEAETVPEGLNIDPSRSLLKIAKWKKAIIMSAGIFMNFVLAIVIFFVYFNSDNTPAGSRRDKCRQSA